MGCLCSGPLLAIIFCITLGRRILSSVFLFLVFIYLLIHLFLAVLGLFFAVCWLSLVVVSRSFSIVMLHRLLMLRSTISRVHGLSSCSLWAQPVTHRL